MGYFFLNTLNFKNAKTSPKVLCKTAFAGVYTVNAILLSTSPPKNVEGVTHVVKKGLVCIYI